MKQLLNYCKSCTLEQIAGVKCSIAGLIRVSENYSVSIETKELSRELYQQIKHSDNDVIYSNFPHQKWDSHLEKSIL